MSYKKCIIVAIVLFISSLLLGLVAPANISGFISKDVAALQEFSSFLTSFPPIVFALLIFVKNASTLILSFILSPFFCLIPILALVINGCLIAFLSPAVIQEKSLYFLLAGILPHGIFELPALIIGEAAAISFGTMIILALFTRKKRILLLPELKQDIKYLIIALGLLLPAAFVETFITPLFLIR